MAAFEPFVNDAEADYRRKETQFKEAKESQDPEKIAAAESARDTAEASMYRVRAMRPGGGAAKVAAAGGEAAGEAATAAAKAVGGMFGGGTSGTAPVQNADGTVSTLRSIGIEEDGKHILIPTVVGGRVVSNEEAIAEYHRTGKNLGVFATREASDAAGQALHESEAKRIGVGGGMLKEGDTYYQTPEAANAAFVAEANRLGLKPGSPERKALGAKYAERVRR
jgi:hypothetical protein